MEFQYLPNGIFISYRRSVSWTLARLVYDFLVSRGYDVFMDVMDEGSVSDLGELLGNEIARRRHYLILLQPGALSRVVNEDDWVRRELELAIFLKRNVVPIITDDFSFGEVELPSRIKTLKEYRGINIGSDTFDAAMERLINDFITADETYEELNTPEITNINELDSPTLVRKQDDLPQTGSLSKQITTPRKPRELPSDGERTILLHDELLRQSIMKYPPNFPGGTCVLLYIDRHTQPVLLDFSQRHTFIVGRNYPGGIYCDIDLSQYFDVNSRYFKPGYGVSRRHFVLRAVANRLLITDTNSRNGTIVNQSRLTSGQTIQVFDSDMVQAGLFRVQVVFKPVQEAYYVYTESTRGGDSRSFLQQLMSAIGFRRRNA